MDWVDYLTSIMINGKFEKKKEITAKEA